MDLTRVEWRGGMSYARSSGLGLGLGSSSSTCSSSTFSLKGELGKGSMIFDGWTEMSTGESGATTRGSRAATKGICVSSGKRSETEEEDNIAGDTKTMRDRL